MVSFWRALKGDDFVGVQTYTRVRFGKDGVLPPPEGAERTQMGYEFYPEALEATIRQAAKISGCPVIVTENGIGTEDDTRRIAYTQRALEGVLRCHHDGIDVRGYIHWSMLDNYEWLEGYRPKFGLVDVDRATQKRTPKPSARGWGTLRSGTRFSPVGSLPFPFGGAIAAGWAGASGFVALQPAHQQRHERIEASAETCITAERQRQVFWHETL